MNLIKRIFKWILYLLLIPIIYILIALILTIITIDRINENQVLDQSIYLNTNGVHLSIVIPKKDIDSLLISGINREKSDKYISFAWGDENFYLNTPTWSDLTISNAFNALFLKSSTLMHINRYKWIGDDWVEVNISQTELEKLNAYILNSFQTDANGNKIILKNQGYSSTDDFYKAKGSYSCLKTSNTWVNSGFKEIGLKACLWTPFDFGLLNKYE